MNLETVERTQLVDPADRERFAHYFARGDLDKAFFEGATITALCGKRDVPTRDFTKFPVCPDCKDIYDGMDE